MEDPLKSPGQIKQTKAASAKLIVALGINNVQMTMLYINFWEIQPLATLNIFVEFELSGNLRELRKPSHVYNLMI